MSETATNLLEERIQAIVDRVRALAAERDALRAEIDVMRARVDEAESAARENSRLRSVLEEAVRELREE
jgi:outer membrane murein-binding lipoprotein Lpp